jgi:hypothetical protein
MVDVFAADRIIWVEGRSEEICFPYLYDALVGEIPQGTTFAAVASTGDFHSKKARSKRVFDIYDTIAKQMGPLVKQVAFSFDRENLTEQKVRDLESKSSGRLLLLPRRCFECYLLDPAAISYLIQMHMPDLSITPETVALKLKELGALRELGAPSDWNADFTNPKWLANVDGARLLDRVVSDVTATRMRFEKVRDTIILAQHAVKTHSTVLKGIEDYLDQLVKLVTTTAIK